MFDWFKGQKSETLQVHRIDFLGEQNGPPEREFKTSILKLLEESGLDAAFLARVLYSDGQVATALCLEGSSPRQKEIVGEIGAKFSAQFNRETSLDMIFLTREQSRNIRSVCRPFFQRAVPG
jgi:hypothetical protein